MAVAPRIVPSPGVMMLRHEAESEQRDERDEARYPGHELIHGIDATPNGAAIHLQGL
jgi:hypothetical protein